MSVKQLIIKRTPSWRLEGVGKAALALGVSPIAVREYASGRRPNALGPAKRSRIKIVTVTKEE